MYSLHLHLPRRFLRVQCSTCPGYLSWLPILAYPGSILTIYPDNTSEENPRRMSRLNVTVPSVEFTMSQTVAFTPQYPQPFTLQEAMNLELDSLVAGKSASAMELEGC